MSALPGSLSLFLPLLVKMLKGPGKFFIALNGLMTGLLLWLAIRAVQDGHSAVWVILVIAAVLLLGIVVFAIRGYQLSKHVDDLEKLNLDAGQDVEIYTADGRSTRDAEMEQRFTDAAYEASRRDTSFMPRVKAAQRAAIAAAGGTVQAPYLKADLRITIIAGMLTMIAGPLSFFLFIITAVIS